jgi:hypothetical protein
MEETRCAGVDRRRAFFEPALLELALAPTRLKPCAGSTPAASINIIIQSGDAWPRVSPEEPRLLEVIVGGAAPTVLSLPTAFRPRCAAVLAAARPAANPLVVAAATLYDVERDDEHARVTVGDTSAAWTTGARSDV